MGIERTVALSSISGASKMWPHLGQRNLVVPLNMIVCFYPTKLTSIIAIMRQCGNNPLATLQIYSKFRGLSGSYLVQMHMKMLITRTLFPFFDILRTNPLPDMPSGVPQWAISHIIR